MWKHIYDYVSFGYLPCEFFTVTAFTDNGRERSRKAMKRHLSMTHALLESLADERPGLFAPDADHS